MKKKSIWKITIYNEEDATTLYFIAPTKICAVFKYKNWVKENGSKSDIDEYTDFDIEFYNFVYE